MKNTATYKVKVEFAWKYPGKPLQTVHKSGLVQTDKTEDKLIAEKFINSFINNYKHGICEVHDLKILSVKRKYTFDDWVEKYKPVKNEFEDTLYLFLRSSITNTFLYAITYIFNEMALFICFHI